jgi:(2Fe-2S) ferredoxin
MLPKPEKHVFVCTQVREFGHPFGSCSQSKAEDTLMLFMAEVKQRELDGKVQVTNTGCLGGPCAAGPTVLVYPEGVKYHNVKTPEDVAAIFDEHLVGGTPVERLQVPKDMWG